jgi:uncharacterized membrane protein YgdD (TMEM256/DUF423 family)
MLGCLFCVLTVGMGAFGAHALKGILTPDTAPIFETATKYMMFHAVALLALGLWSHWERWASSFWAGLFFVFGIILFSGSLYGIVFTGQRWLGMITPAGGTLFILGWLLFMFSVFKTRNKFV